MLAKTAETSESEHASRSPSPEREARHAGGGLPGLSAGNRPNFTPPNRPPPAISEAGGELVQRDCDTCEEEPERKVRLSAAAGAFPRGAGAPPQPNSRASGVRIGAPAGPLE